MSCFLPEKDLEYLVTKGIVFEKLDADGKKAVILKGRTVPLGRFDGDVVDVLILLPPGYPDVAPDMFYLFPWLRLLPGKTFPKATDQPMDFAGRRWQRWSRHNNEWRPGIDGLWTMIKRVDHALESAA